MTNKRPYTEPCAHAATVHGSNICIICYRNRLIAACDLLEETMEAKKRQAQMVWNDAIESAIDEATTEYDKEAERTNRYADAADLHIAQMLTASRITDRLRTLLHKEEKEND